MGSDSEQSYGGSLPTLSADAKEFVQSVLDLQPPIAVFDCDGTLWSGDAGADFFYWELEQGLIPAHVERRIRPRYDEYMAGKVEEVVMCGEMVTMHEGLRLADLEAAAEQFVKERVRQNFFPEMLALTRALSESGCELWAVSSTNEWVVRAGIRPFGIPGDHVLAACVYSENSRATGRLWRVPTDEAKAQAILEVIARPVDAVFGNSMHDAAMLEIARHAFAVNPNTDLEKLANERGWRVYRPDRTDAATLT